MATNINITYESGDGGGEESRERADNSAHLRNSEFTQTTVKRSLLLLGFYTVPRKGPKAETFNSKYSSGSSREGSSHVSYHAEDRVRFSVPRAGGGRQLEVLSMDGNRCDANGSVSATPSRFPVL